MSIYIPGMEMPKSCLACDWCAHTIPADNYICYRLNRAVVGVAEEDVNESVNVCCPLIPVPEHGDLIDRDALSKSLDKLCDRVCQYSKAQRKVMCGACPLGHAFAVVEDDAPAIIEADRE